MADYALYFINSKLGYFERELPLDAVNDQVAIGIARRHCGGQALELWCGGRLVERFPEEPPVAPPSQVANRLRAACRRGKRRETSRFQRPFP